MAKAVNVPSPRRLSFWGSKPLRLMTSPSLACIHMPVIMCKLHLETGGDL